MMQNIEFFIKKHYKDILIVAFITIIVGIVAVNLIVFQDTQAATVDEVAYTALDDKKEKTELINIHVDVKGAVKKPGVYEVSLGSMVNDLIELAGGFSTNAYANGINLSKKVRDEMVIYVYTKSEVDTKKAQEKIDDVCIAPTYNIIDCVDEKNSIIVPEKIEISDTNDSISTNNNSLDDTQSDKSSDESVNSTVCNPNSNLVNINTADITTLMTINGIGESKAESIIEYREKNGKFNSISDIKNVSGIGDALFNKIKDSITV